MQTIGEKIEETRKRKGISLSEAAEATKIRRDFLLNIESNEYDYDLPEIYKRGFIKNYAKFLKLNPEKILSQYQEQLITQSSRSKKTNPDLFHTNKPLNESSGQASLDPLLEKPSFGKINLNSPTETLEDTASSEEPPSNNEVYIKTAIFGLSTLLFILGIIWLVQTISQSAKPNQEALASSSNSTNTSSIAQTSADKTVTEYAIKEVTLKSSGSVYVQIRQKLDNKVLLAKQLIEGEIQTIKRRGPVDIAFTKGSFITLIADGEIDTIQPNTSGPGKITLP